MSDPMCDMWLAEQERKRSERQEPFLSLKWAVINSGLLVPSCFVTTAEETVEEAYNGCGPERWPQIARALADKIAHFYKLAVVVHDFDFSLSDGSREKFDEANSRFAKNCRKLYRAEFPLFEGGLPNFRWFLPTYHRRAALLFSLGASLSIAVTLPAGWRAWKEQAQKGA